MLEQSDFFIFMVLILIGTAAVIFAATPWFAVVCIPTLGAYIYFVQLYRQVSRESKRLESVARSPVFAHYSETLGGISTIRAYAAEERFTTTNMHLVDALNEAYYLNKVADRWLAVRLELIGAVMTLGAAVLAVLNVVLSRQNGIAIDPVYVGLAGASLSGATGITGILNFVMRCVQPALGFRINPRCLVHMPAAVLLSAEVRGTRTNTMHPPSSGHSPCSRRL